LVLGECLEIRDNHLCAIREHMSDSKWSRPAGLKLARENIQSRVKEEDYITNIENAVFDFGVTKPLSFLFVDQRVLIGLITKNSWILKTCAKDFVIQSSLPQLHLGILYPNLID
nr:hypothetical protein [Tanacetum cinerariifolium]